jgi:hypothetical protein
VRLVHTLAIARRKFPYHQINAFYREGPVRRADASSAISCAGRARLCRRLVGIDESAQEPLAATSSPSPFLPFRA